MIRFMPLILLPGTAHAFTGGRLDEAQVSFMPGTAAGQSNTPPAAFSIEPEEIVLAYLLNNTFPFNFARPAGQQPTKN